MKAEEEFVNSLSDEVCKNIQRAISGRFQPEMAKVTQKLKALAAPNAAMNYCQAVTVDCVSAIAPSYIYATPSGIYASTGETPTPQQAGNKEEKMGTDIETARRHMDTRLYTIKTDKRVALKTQFGLQDDESPKSFADTVARLKAGLFTLPTNESEFDTYNVLEYLRWRDPAKKEDLPGFDAAVKLMQAAATKVKDAIWVKTNPEDALAALEAFESSTVN